MQKIDFVVTWVDGSDPVWLKEKNMYLGGDAATSGTDVDANANCRYRDYGVLRYWFRAVERFAPWVNRVFFVTCGQKPEWLDESCPKLRLVNHTEYIPAEWLPTFQSNAIELNLHRIADLSERFVLFNDDTFLLQSIPPEFFFKGGLPVIPCDLAIPRWIGGSNTSHVIINNTGVLKAGLDVERLIRKNFLKYVNVCALGPVRAIKNAVSFAVNRAFIPGMFGHMPQSHLKSTFEEIWRARPHALERTSQSRFRTNDCVNQWLASAWNVVSGRFYPANEKRRGEFITLTDQTLEMACGVIRSQATSQICLNDKGVNADSDRCFGEIAKAFESILPEKSSFEK